MTKLSKIVVAQIRTNQVANLAVVEDALKARGSLEDPVVDTAWAEVQTFFALAVRVLATVNHSKVTSELRTIEIAARLAGRPVISE